MRKKAFVLQLFKIFSLFSNKRHKTLFFKWYTALLNCHVSIWPVFNKQCLFAQFQGSWKCICCRHCSLAAAPLVLLHNRKKQLKSTKREVWFIWEGNEGREGKRPRKAKAERNGAWVAGFLKHLAVVVHGDRWLPSGALSYQQTGPAAEAFGF